jgi:ketosteroid isomerase-like protein
MNTAHIHHTRRAFATTFARLLVGMLFALALAGETKTAFAAQTTDAMLDAYVSGLNARMPPKGDPATVPELFAEDGVHYHPFGEPPGGPLRGREALKGFFGGFKDAWADWTHVEKRHTIAGRRAVWEGVAQGTHRQSGKFVKLPIVFIIDFDESGHVKEKTVYVDLHLIAEQVY